MTGTEKHVKQLKELFIDRFSDYFIEGIEIGTGFGGVTQGILELPNVHLLWTIDPWEYRDRDGFEAETGNQEWHDKRQEKAMQAIRLAGGMNRTIILYMTSVLALECIHQFVDFVWIDGHHSQEQVDWDIRNYAPLVRPGGLIGGHDYCTKFNSVKLAIDHLFPPDVIHTGDNTVWWVLEGDICNAYS